jgi:hypothetical protein
MIWRLFGLASWDPYVGLTPEDFAVQQRRRRWVWLAVGIVVTIALAARW